MAQSIIIAGGSGFLGLSLAQQLAAKGHAVTILSRSAPRAAGPWKHIPWTPARLAPGKTR